MNAFQKAAAVVVLFGAMTSICSAQQNAEQAPPASSSKSQLDVRPAAHSTTEIWMIVDGERRSLGGHLPAPDPGVSPVMDLFARPTFLFIPNEKAGAEDRGIHDVFYAEEGPIYVTFKLEVCSPIVRELFKEKLIKEQPEYLAKRNKKATAVVVERWPLIHLVLRVYDSRSNKLLSQGETHSLVRFGDQVEIKIPFSPDSLKAFREAVAAKSAMFVPYYTYTNRQTVSMEKKVEISAEMAMRINAICESRQAAGNGPIFQGDAENLIANAKFGIESQITATSPQLLPFLGDSSGYINQLFTFQDTTIASLQQDHLRALNAYLQPLIDTVQEVTGATISTQEGNENESVDTKGHSHTTQSGTTTGINGATKGSYNTVVYGNYEGTAGFFKQWSKSNSNTRSEEQTKRVLDMFQKITGVTLQKGKTSNEYVAHSVRIYSPKSAETVGKISDHGTYAVGIGTEQGYLEDSPFYLHWTNDIVRFEPEDSNRK